MSGINPRSAEGAKVHAKAWHITSHSECSRRFGSNAKTKLLNGIVSEVITVPSSQGKRAATRVIAIYSLDDQCRKVATLSSRSVKDGHVESSSVYARGLGTGLGTGTVDADVGGSAHVETPTIDVDTVLSEVEGSEEEMDRKPAAVDVPGDDEEEEKQEHCEWQQPHNVGEPVADVHGTQWFMTSAFELPLNGNVPYRKWSIRTLIGDVLIPGTNTATTNDMSALDFFLVMFPPKQLNNMVQFSNDELTQFNLPRTNISELLKFFGVIILTTKFEFTSRTSLWSTVAPSKYRPAPLFGQTGMSKHRFEDLFRCVRWSRQPYVKGEESSEAYRWKLVDDFVHNFNEHRANYFTPSDCICVDESMSRWYGQGGH